MEIQFQLMASNINSNNTSVDPSLADQDNVFTRETNPMAYFQVAMGQD